MHVQTWALHDAVFELARELGLRSYRVECKVGPEGETIIALVLSASDGRALASERREKRRS